MHQPVQDGIGERVVYKGAQTVDDLEVKRDAVFRRSCVMLGIVHAGAPVFILLILRRDPVTN